mmetsp:Transcript_37915/g.61441  ORF Transcript_37915/g.61441 Transcript_37915/m.61441 type:complete len:463 (-) Transcript_37915:243-1631(-)|eukprot:CAMPEP_0184337990 /NCGR_PEP_ID=MMETSP1089-20130417/6500_1 /TAXON_ID=38269 ORGANISM="Gloeochaete wittrockiana, Strain SAG46.84" /NCGR_SAMPLE_ID=MMETSP1089 /ASSEMBLY_ACC=CAM_ASM_000445 /LENGTH=462 /DNA_ID=CAMNT_0026664189 /DNA_START=26 /DNA_END=1414 /DNA_ORIENTATION=-
MYGGDEVSAIVIDIGSTNVKAGYAGEDQPKAVFSSKVGVLAAPSGQGDGFIGQAEKTPGDEASAELTNGTSSAPQPVGAAPRSSKKYVVGTSALHFRRDEMEVISPFEAGLITDWDVAEQLLEHTFKSRLMVEPSEHPMLLAEPSFNNKAQRDKYCQIMFEKFKCPALFMAKNAVLSAFAFGRSTGVVLDCGGGVTSAVPVHDGYALTKSIVKSPLAGETLTDHLLQLLEKKYGSLRPNYMFEKKEIKPGEFQVTAKDFPRTTQSYKRYMQQAIVRDVKESCCRVSEASFDPSGNQNIPVAVVDYELPDGTKIGLTTERFLIPEIMFNPSLLYSDGISNGGSEGDAQRAASGERPLGVHMMVKEAVNKCDADIRKDLYNSVIITGGNSSFPAFQDRIQKDLSEAAPPQLKVKTVQVPSSTERKFSVFIGGSILASLGSFQQMWMSRQEYEEHGPALLEKKCP